MKSLKESTIAIFWALVGAFIVVLAEFFIPAFRDLFKSSKLFWGPLAVFFLLGSALLFLALKAKKRTELKKFLILTGASASGFFISVILHNLFYAIGVLTNHILVLKYLMEFLNIAFFLIGIFICPLGFLIGAIGTITLLIKQREK